MGRACGYPRSAVAEEDNIYQVEVYLNEKILKSKEIDRYIEMVDTLHDGLVSVLPKKAKNLAKETTQTSKAIIPIRVSRTDENNDRATIIKHVVKCIREQSNIENKNDDDEYAEMREKIMRLATSDSSKFKVFYLDDAKRTRNGKKAQMILDAFEQSEARDFGSGCGMDDINTTDQINIWVPKNVAFDKKKLFITSHVSTRHVDKLLCLRVRKCLRAVSQKS